ncbi:MAG: hypothetical protein Q9216_006793 [Gyalolechia sp. 2 TL-2023]
MEDIHTPTVASGSTSARTAHNTKRHEDVPLLELVAEKAGLEEELKALGGVLDSHGVNMNTSLTTFDGYPRDDIDVPQIRTTRARIIRLRNDYKGLMSRIEEGLHSQHAQARELAATQSASAFPNRSTPSANQAARESSTIEAPFAKINSVIAGSPAEDAGLKVGDKICRFGNIDWMNHEKLSKVAETVQRNEGTWLKPPDLKILQPSSWYLLEMVVLERLVFSNRILANLNGNGASTSRAQLGVCQSELAG